MGNTNTPPRADRARRRARTARTRASLSIGTVLAVATTLLTFAPSGAAEAPPVDGKTAASAAASCWEIKQKDPKSASGVYWLVTPAMTAPEQFYCDQVTDGGGWVLVGRGRNDWKEYYQGVGTPKDVSSTVTGTAAFAPKQLSSETVDDLLNGQRPDSLDDGIRLRRARDAAGTTWQEGRMKISAKPYWNWAFGSRTPVTSYSFTYGGSVASGTSGTTNDIGTTGTARMRFEDTAETSWQRGFRYGDEMAGSNTSTTYLWSPATGGKGAMPFTQVYLRPKVDQKSFSGKEIPDSGTAAIAQRALPNSGAEPTKWGAVERADGQGEEMNTEVQALEQIGSTVFTGGNFKAMQRNAAGTGRVAQSYLAAFDVNTGELRTDFRPVFDGQVKALAELPNNRLAVGGRFSTVNGVSSPGFVVLDATTGKVDTAWNLKVENLLTNGVLQVRTLDVQGDWLYLGGAFTHLSGGQETGRVYARAGARVKISTRTPDTSWNPEFNGTVTSIDASTKGDRLYAAGYFNQSQDASAFRLASVRTTAGAPLDTWTWDPSIPVDYANPGQDGFQLAVREQGNTVWAGGAEHSMFGFDRSTFQRTSTGITTAGGDIQAITSTDSTVFGACHCFNWFNAGATKWTRLSTQPTTVADRINAIGAWDAGSGRFIPGFNPEIKGFGGWGIWATLMDSNGVLWTGGDVNRSVSSTGSPQWSGGFLRFAPRDAKAPAAPTGLKVGLDGTSDALTWTAAPESGVTYQVLRNDRPVGTATGTSLKVPHVDGARYAVRAADAAGNVSASTPVVPAGTEPAPEPQPEPEPGTSTLIAAGATWKYHHSRDVSPGADWTSTGFDDSAWKQGSAVLGWGDSSVKTTLVADGTRPIVTQFRRTVDVADATKVAKLTLTTRADDGVVLFVNGKEVVRSNVTDGSLTDDPYATAPRRTATAVAEPVVVEVPGSALKTGKNVISAQMHSNWTNTTDASFDLTAVATAGTQPAPPAEEEPPAEEPPAEEPAGPDALVAAGAEWRYHHDRANPPAADWAGTEFDDTSWQKGSAVLGWGSDQVRTTLVADGTRPLVSYFRRTVDVADASAVAKLKITTRADDGIAVHVNGHEVLRSNLAEGSLEDHPWALTPRRTAVAEAEPVVVEVPAGMLRDGENVIAAQMHSNWTNTTDTSFDLTVETVAGTQPAPPAEEEKPPAEEPQQPADPDALVAEGAAWRYHHDRENPPARGWASTDFDDASWKQGSAVLGWGGDQVRTTLVADGTRPLTTYFRRSVQVADASTVEKLTLTTRADDGIAVYVNGEEVTRSNLPDGVLSSGTYATAPRRTATAVAEPVTVEVPGWMLRDGKNVIAAEMHSNWTNTTDASFDLKAVVTEGEQPEAPAVLPDVIARGAEWSYRHEDSAPEDDWQEAGAVTGWLKGKAPFGWGTPVATELTTDGRRPVATQFRKEFTVADPAALGDLQLTTRADDGIVVRVNGKEIVRSNMPEGDLDWTSYTLGARRTTAALADPVTAVVPASALKAGVNVVSVSMHLDYRATPDASFDLELAPRPEDAA
ncbi:fibrinogen-like YCDxxxxGGGW domain-containing protein [Kocuria sp. CPCC 205292]|uniref:fibrinogen-like YCDxxxxGGGW domain-containing protein n=1 Tax=Kocuria cellulosilytica TaxID=3071451 RepID=UPI0034D61C97